MKKWQKIFTASPITVNSGLYEVNDMSIDIIGKEIIKNKGR